MFVMPSKALRRWFKSQAVALDQMENAHTSVGGKGRGRRYTTDQINQAYAVLLASQFQGFCRDLHSESAENLVDILEPPSLRPIVQAEFTRELDTGEKGGKAVINGYILSYDARTTNPKTRTEGRRPEQLTNQSRTAIRVQGEGLSFVTKIQPTEVEGMTSLAPGLFDIAERVRSMFSHACA